MKKCFCFVGVFFSVLLILTYLAKHNSSPVYIKIADKITANTAGKLEKEKGLICIGTGGQMMDDIQMMMMAFDFYQVVDINRARQLLIEATEEYLSAINSNEQVRPFLHNYPFSSENVHVVIYFYDSPKSKVPPASIAIAASKRGKLFYYIDDPETDTLKTIYEESYEEGFKIINRS